MKRVTGLGGFFFKTADPKRTLEWYRNHLGIPFDGTFDGWPFNWRNAEEPEKKGSTVLGLFSKDTKYFGPSPAPFMCNFRVHDLDALLEALATEGVKIDPAREESEFGRFAWIYDPEGNKIELWEPPEGQRG